MKLNQCTTSPQLGPDLEQDGGQLWHHLPAPDQRSCAQLELQETQPESLVRLLNWILEWRVDKPEGPQLCQFILCFGNSERLLSFQFRLKTSIQSHKTPSASTAKLFSNKQ